jgi:hypothetical protein
MIAELIRNCGKTHLDQKRVEVNTLEQMKRIVEG